MPLHIAPEVAPPVLGPAHYSPGARQASIARRMHHHSFGRHPEDQLLGRTRRPREGEHSVAPELKGLGHVCRVSDARGDEELATSPVEPQGDGDLEPRAVIGVPNPHPSPVLPGEQLIVPGAIFVQAMLIGGKGPLDAAGCQPPPSVTPTGRFDRRVMIGEALSSDFIIPVEHPPSQLREHHGPRIGIFEHDGRIGAGSQSRDGIEVKGGIGVEGLVGLRG